MHPRQRELLENAHRGQCRTWATMILVPFFYLVLGHWLGPKLQELQVERFLSMALLRGFFYLLALAAIAYAWHLRRATVNGHLPRLIRSIAPRMARSSSPEAPVAAIVYHSATVICLGIAESIALLGLILHLFGDSVYLLYFFANAAAAAMIFFRPQLGDMEKMARQFATEEASSSAPG